MRRLVGPADFGAAFRVSRETLARLATYEDLLRRWQRAMNLVAPSTLDAIWHRHFADSAQLAPLAPTARTWVDLGSGAGFPGLIVAILLAGEPSLRAADSPSASATAQVGPARITLIESNARKCAFLREVVRATQIAGSVSVDILSTRIETATTQASLPSPDVVSARAVAPLDKLFALAAPLFASSTVGLFLKGRDVAAELQAAEKLWNFQSELVPSRTERDARIVVVRKLEHKNEGRTS
ncbi:MAG TPA: 16S rRNA (guanine(527)-N(7))-methyltransferase RsmG [Hyphomicrobiaceae bacterium]|jgi:16S rRNA (guanine527-N7)-methyltransferase